MKQATKDKKRLDKLKEILTTLESGNVQNRTLKTWLTADEFAGFESGWEEQKELRELYKCKPDEIKEYENYLKKAIFDYSKAEGYSLRDTKTAEKFYDSAESKFETTLERLQEITEADPDLQMWFDRALDFSAGNNLGIDPICIPRVVTSRSLDSLSGIAGLLSKKEVKRQCVEKAIDILLNPITEVDKMAQAKKLKEMLANLKN